MNFNIEATKVYGVQLVVIHNFQGHAISSIPIDRLGAICPCPWSPQLGKCIHLVLMEILLERKLEDFIPESRGGKKWFWI